MKYAFRSMQKTDQKPVIDIFNYFIENGFTVYPDQRMSYDFFNFLLDVTKGYLAIVIINEDENDKVIGFAFMRKFHPFNTFNRTVEVTYMILSEYTRKGIGSKIVKFFEEEAKKMKIDCLLAEISSLNEESINFHKKMGFEHCGCFKRVGYKFGKDFDIVWMQKLL